jgi:hypothetical protein
VNAIKRLEREIEEIDRQYEHVLEMRDEAEQGGDEQEMEHWVTQEFLLREVGQAKDRELAELLRA